MFLRGQVDSEELRGDIAASVAAIRGVGEVVNLLHTPGTEAPHADNGRTPVAEPTI